MKNSKIRIVLYSLFIFLSIAGCNPNIEPEKETEQIVEPTATFAVIQNTARSATDDESPPFVIQANEVYQPILTVLYKAYYQNRDPIFVESDADLVLDITSGDYQDHPVVYPTFMWGFYLVSKTELEEVENFIDFAQSVDGRETLDNAGDLIADQELTDQAGNIVLIDQPIRRVISTYGPSTAFIYAVGAGDRLVSASYLGARDHLGAAVMEKIDPRFPALMGDDYFSQDDFNIEQAAVLDPDLIVTSARTAWLETVAQLDIPVFLYDAETIDRLKEAMLLTGQIFGPHAYAQSEAWVSYFENVVNKVSTETSDIPEDERLRVLFTGTQPLRVASGDMFQTSIIELAGGVSVSSELSGYWNDVDLEQIAIWDPDVIIVPPYGGATVEAITESPEWQILNAVQSGHVYQMPKLVVPWDTPAPDSVLGIIWMAKLLNPELNDLDCTEEAQYFYNTFYNYQVTQEELSMICFYE